MSRHLVLFARDPRRESQAKGFGLPGEDLFAAFALGWFAAAQRHGARFVIATPPEDRPAWRNRLPDDAPVSWIAQRGCTFGQRLEGVARDAGQLPGPAILVGGDVAPSETAVAEAFAALESGADAVLGPASDGGVSLVGLSGQDADLLRSVAPRQRGVVDRLRQGLAARGRRLVLVASAPDVDGKSSLLSLERGLASRETRTLVRLILRAVRPVCADAIPNRPIPPRAAPTGPRAPPALL